MTTTATERAETFPYTTAAELRAVLNDTPTLHDLDDLMACAPVDLDAFNDRMEGIVANKDSTSPADSREAVHAALMACALPGHVVDAEFAALIHQTIVLVGKLTQAARAELLAALVDATRTRDADSLLVALGKAPFSSTAYVEYLRALADATAPGEPNDPVRMRGDQVRALQSSATAPMDDELAGAIVDALQAWNIARNETPQQKAIREAFTHARGLMDTLGEDDHRTFSAVIKALNLQDPGYTERMLGECGIHLPQPDCCTPEGEPLYSLAAVADALGADSAELLVQAQELEGFGLVALHNGISHVLQ